MTNAFSKLKHAPKKVVPPRFQLAGIIKRPAQTCSACKKS